MARRRREIDLPEVMCYVLAAALVPLMIIAVIVV